MKPEILNIFGGFYLGLKKPGTGLRPKALAQPVGNRSVDHQPLSIRFRVDEKRFDVDGAYDIRYEIDFAAGHKTGFFCDQRENRRRVRDLASGRSVLDLCSYTAGFSINAALGGAGEVTAVDLDEGAIAMGRRNANLNDAKVRFTHGDAFTWARQMVKNERKWDLIIVDPPKFITGRDDRLGHNKYHDLNSLALQLLAPGGVFITCSCSGQLDADAFERIITGAAHRKDKRLQIFDRTGAGPDHPTLSNYPESRYLKLLWSRVL